MLDRRVQRVWDNCRNKGGLFFVRLLFVVLLWALVGGILCTSFLFLVREIPFQGNIDFFLISVLGIAIVIPVFTIIFFKRFSRIRYQDAFSHLDLDSRQQRLLMQILQKQQYREFEEAVVQYQEERLFSLEEEEKQKLYTLRRFGLVVPGDQQDKILEDDRFYALLGIEKDAFVVCCGIRGVDGLLAHGDETAANGCRKALLKATTGFASQCRLLLPEYVPSCTFMYYGLPYETVKVDIKKISKRAERWCKETDKALLAAGLEGESACFIAHGFLSAGLVENSAGSAYVVIGSLLSEMRTACSDPRFSGVFLHSSLEESGLTDDGGMWAPVL